jgi:hypothetical protein
MYMLPFLFGLYGYWLQTQISLSLSPLINNQSTRYSMSWCAGWLTWWGPLQRGDLLWVQSLLIEALAPRRWGFYLKSNSTNYPDHGHQGILPHKENPHGRARNRSRDLVISSQKLWPPDHEARHKSVTKLLTLHLINNYFVPIFL